jgi:hypothetical protein
LLGLKPRRAAAASSVNDDANDDAAPSVSFASSAIISFASASSVTNPLLMAALIATDGCAMAQGVAYSLGLKGGPGRALYPEPRLQTSEASFLDGCADRC